MSMLSSLLECIATMVQRSTSRIRQLKFMMAKLRILISAQLERNHISANFGESNLFQYHLPAVNTCGVINKSILRKIKRITMSKILQEVIILNQGCLLSTTITPAYNCCLKINSIKDTLPFLVKIKVMNSIFQTFINVNS